MFEPWSRFWLHGCIFAPVVKNSLTYLHTPGAVFSWVAGVSRSLSLVFPKLPCPERTTPPDRQHSPSPGNASPNFPKQAVQADILTWRFLPPPWPSQFQTNQWQSQGFVAAYSRCKLSRILTVFPIKEQGAFPAPPKLLTLVRIEFYHTRSKHVNLVSSFSAFWTTSFPFSFPCCRKHLQFTKNRVKLLIKIRVLKVLL